MANCWLYKMFNAHIKCICYGTRKRCCTAEAHYTFYSATRLHIETDGQIDVCWAEIQRKTHTHAHKKTTTTYKHARTHAVKCKILMKIKRIEQTDQKTIWKIYCVGSNGIKCNLHVMLDFQRTSTKCHIALFVLHRLFPSFSSTLANTLSECERHPCLLSFLWWFIIDALSEEREREITILGVLKWDFRDLGCSSVDLAAFLFGDL